ncbi:MAG: DMT family transporter [Thermoanaerobaculia bacterium]
MRPRVGAFLAIIFWGISFVATKAALAEVSPITVIFTRFAIGVVVLYLILAFRRAPLAPPRDAVPMLLVMGFIGVFVHQLLQSYALTMTSAVNTGWLIGISPIWSALFAAAFLRERFGVIKVAGLVVGFLGALIVITRGELSGAVLQLPSTRGDLMIVLSTLNWSIYTVLGHRTIRAIGPTRATAGGMLFGTLLLAPFFLVSEKWHEWGRLSSVGWISILFLGIACSALGYLFWYGALEKIEASRVAAFLYLEPLVTLAAAVALLREPVTTPTIAGGLVVLAGVLLVQRAPAAPRPVPVPAADGGER